MFKIQIYPLYANTVNNFPFTKSIRFIYFSKKEDWDYIVHFRRAWIISCKFVYVIR